MHLKDVNDFYAREGGGVQFRYLGRAFSLTRSTVKAFAVMFRVLNRKNMTDYALF